MHYRDCIFEPGIRWKMQQTSVFGRSGIDTSVCWMVDKKGASTFLVFFTFYQNLWISKQQEKNSSSSYVFHKIRGSTKCRLYKKLMKSHQLPTFYCWSAKICFRFFLLFRGTKLGTTHARRKTFSTSSCFFYEATKSS